MKNHFKIAWEIFWILGGIAALTAMRLEARGAEHSTQTRVAIIDTGLDIEDPRFKSHICPGVNSNKSFVGSSIKDTHGHGTHIAGIILAMAAGRPDVCLLICKFYSDSNPGVVNLASTVKCLDFAREQKADIVNYSGGGPEFSESEYLALKKLSESSVIVAAAGNEHADIDKAENYYYPASYKVLNMQIVGSVDFLGKHSIFSNFGYSISSEEPGENIFSTLPGSQHYGYMSGTSQATAVATGQILRSRFHLPEIHGQAVYLHLQSFWRQFLGSR